MKKILMLSVAALALSSASFAATFTIGCTIGAASAASPGVLTGVDISVCQGLSLAAGSTISSVEFSVLTGFTGNGFSNDSLTITGTYTPTVGTFTVNPVMCATTGTGNVSSTTCGTIPSPGFTSQTSGLGGASVAGTTFNVGWGISGDAGLPFNGSVSGQAVVTFTYDLPQSGIPEPSTVALIGAGLVGVASIARRRR